MRHAASVPDIRLRRCNEAPVQADGKYVLYWMIAFRRTTWNFGLQRAVEWARELKKPLLVFEPLRAGYRWASDRLHRFVIDGMADNARRLSPLQARGVFYYPYVEPRPDADKGLLAALARRACIIITDDYPGFFLPRMIRAAAKMPVRLESVDSNGLLPLRVTDRVFTTAASFRRFLQKHLPPHLHELPRRDPLAGVKLPTRATPSPDIPRRWPPASPALLGGESRAFTTLPIDHSVSPVSYRGGPTAARAVLKEFLKGKLDRYSEAGNHPDQDARSGLSPYLHFGHISPHEVFQNVVKREEWSAERLASRPTGRRDGWWGLSASAEGFLDEIITWRELGYNMSANRDDYDRYESLPDWARATLAKHAADPRPHVYELAEFEAARTHDPLWNAAQVQLLREGRIHNYLRMLWGKKILEWTASPQEALAVLIELNNKYAVDGRDPNSYSGIFWILGRYDRPWGPERPVFGTIRYMSSASTARKLRLRHYLARYSSGDSPISGAR